MSAPVELSFDEILKFMLEHNGKVTNHDLVKYFKVFLMNPNMRDEARNTFKKHVNTLAIIKTQNNEKWLILKKKYFPSNIKENENDNKVVEPVTQQNEENIEEEAEEKPPARPPLPSLPLLNQDFNMLGSILPIHNTIVDVPEYPQSPALYQQNVSQESLMEDVPPKVHPRRKSEKNLMEKSPSNSSILQISNNETMELNETPSLVSSQSESMLVDSEHKISVKERKQMFNRMASESDVLKLNKSGNNISSMDEDDRASLDHKETEPLDSKQKQWILYAARGDYHVLAKMCKENSKLVKTKDPFTTAMHWACKRGDENLVKLLAGIHRHTVNERSGYTPLHIAMQFRRENVYRLLVEVYDADPNVRDWSGKKPRQYLVHMDTSLSPGSYRSTEKISERNIQSPPILISPSNIPQYLSPYSKKEGFLRIGSLNVRVKKTTEAFSNFLGVGATRSSAYVPKSARERELDRRSDDSDQLKSWGSADNIQKDDKMPPPINKVRRRGASGRRGVAAHSRSTPSTPDQPRAQIGGDGNGDSDSDSAAGFHSTWRQRASQS